MTVVLPFQLTESDPGAVALGDVVYVGRGGHETREGRTADGVHVAVKTCVARASEDARDRLEHEATILARLARVDGVVRMRSYDPERAVLVTAYAPGRSLHELRDRGELRRRDALSIAVRLLRVLRRVHALGIVHRDVAPGNIIYDVRTGSVVLCDFGQACDLRAPTRFQKEWRDVEVGTPAFRLATLARDATAGDPWVDLVSVAKVTRWIAWRG